MQVKASQAVRMITKAIRAKLVPLMVGPPGIGKSAICHQIAKEYGLMLIDLRLSQCDPTDLLGFPAILKNDKAGYRPFETFPMEGDPIPESYNGWLLFLDEANSCKEAVQAAAYKLVLDRMVGQKKLHSKCAIVCAGNREEDGAIVMPLSSALKSRLMHMELLADHHEWLDYASAAGIHHYCSDFIKFKPKFLHTFNPDSPDNAYACPRTWEFASNVLHQEPIDSPDLLPMLAGILSEGIAREFLIHCKIYKEIPKIEEIQKEPETTKVPKETSVMWALTGSIAQNATSENFEQLVKYVTRMETEFQVTMREAVRRNPKLGHHKSTLQWGRHRGVELM